MNPLRLALGVALLPFALSAQTYYEFYDGDDVTIDGDVEFDENGLTLFIDSGSATFTGRLPEEQSLGGYLYKEGAGTLTLNGPNDSFLPIWISAGTLVMGTSEAFGLTPKVFMPFDWNTGTAAVLRFSADVTTPAAFAGDVINIEVDPSVTVALLGGTIRGSGGGVGNILVKSGAGTLAIGSSGLFGSGSAITGGTLRVGGGRFDNNANVSIAAGATLLYGGSATFTERAILDGEGSVVVAGDGGTFTFSRQHTYTGGTTITSGTLRLGSSDCLADTGALIMNGGTFNSNGYDETLGTLSVTADSFLDFGSGTSDLVFADSSALTWLGTLTLLNFTVGSDTLRIGTDSNGLTFEQLGLINFGDGLWAHIDSLGFVTPSTEPPASAIPEPGACAAVAGVFALAGALFRRRNRGSA